MDEALREELNRKFHSTKRAQIVRNRLTKEARFEKEDFITYSYYRYRYNILLTKIRVLRYSIKNSYSKNYIREDARSLINETFQFDGYIECLFDLYVISECDYDKFFDFTKQIRYEANEIILYIDNTI